MTAPALPKDVQEAIYRFGEAKGLAWHLGEHGEDAHEFRNALTASDAAYCALVDAIASYVGALSTANRRIDELAWALQGLEEPDEPGRYCPHAWSVEPCWRCERARKAMAKAPDGGDHG